MELFWNLPLGGPLAQNSPKPPTVVVPVRCAVCLAACTEAPTWGAAVGVCCLGQSPPPLPCLLLAAHRPGPQGIGPWGLTGGVLRLPMPPESQEAALI